MAPAEARLAGRYAELMGHDLSSKGYIWVTAMSRTADLGHSLTGVGLSDEQVRAVVTKIYVEWD